MVSPVSMWHEAQTPAPTSASSVPGACLCEGGCGDSPTLEMMWWVDCPGQVPPPPSKLDVIHRLYVDREPVSALDTMLGICDGNPDLQSYIGDLLVELEAPKSERMSQPDRPAA